LEGVGRGEKTTCKLNAGLSEKVLEEIGDPLEWRDPVGERVLSQSVWNGVAGISSPTLQDERAYVDRPLGQPAAWSVFLCRMNWMQDWA
jgi:hypothetical protein